MAVLFFCSKAQLTCHTNPVTLILPWKLEIENWKSTNWKTKLHRRRTAIFFCAVGCSFFSWLQVATYLWFWCAQIISASKFECCWLIGRHFIGADRNSSTNHSRQKQFAFTFSFLCQAHMTLHITFYADITNKYKW